MSALSDSWGEFSLMRSREEILEWMEKNVVVSTGDLRGRFQAMPYQRGVIRSLGDPETSQVTVMCASQVGKTLMFAGGLMWTMRTYPGTGVMCMFPSLDVLNKFRREKLNPIMESSGFDAHVRNMRAGQQVPPNFSMDNGAYVTMSTSGSRSGGAHGTTAQFTFLDEVDDYGYDVVGDVMQRTATAADAHVMLCSTPKSMLRSIINRHFRAGTQERWHSQCRYCGETEMLDIGNVRPWDMDLFLSMVPEGVDNLEQQQVAEFLDQAEPCPNCGEQVHYLCPHCESLWSDSDRRQAIYAGEWIADRPMRRREHRSFHLNQLTSLLVPMRRTWRDFWTYEPDTRQTQLNAEPYELRMQEPQEPAKIRRTQGPPFTPSFVTCGVDVQKDRIEWSVWDYDRLLSRMHVLSAGKAARTEGPACWEQMWMALNNNYYLPNAIQVDGGYALEWVITTLRAFWPAQVFLERPTLEVVRGNTAPSLHKPPRTSGFCQSLATGKPTVISTDKIKLLLMTAVEEDLITVDESCPSYVEAQICSEYLVQDKMTPMSPRYQPTWVRVSSTIPNEILDTGVYSYSGAWRRHLEVR